MAVSKIQGRDVGLYVQKMVNGVPTWVAVGCTTDMTLDVDTDSDESTCTASGLAKEFEAGQYSWSVSANMNVRQATDVAAGGGGTPPAQTDATDNVTAENFLDFQLNNTPLQIRFSIGKGVGVARYAGACFLTKGSFKGQQKGIATYSASFQGTGQLTKSLATS